MPTRAPKRTREESDDDRSEEDPTGSDNDSISVDLDEMSLTQLKEAFRTTQLAKNQAEKKMRQVLGDVTNQSSPPTAKQKKSRRKGAKRRRVREDSSERGGTPEDGSADETESEPDLDERKKKVESYGHRFVLLKGLWLKKETFEVTITEDYDEARRFDGGEAQGQLRDIQDILPQKYHGKIMRASWFEKAFRAGMQAQRSNTSTRIRRQAGAAIYDCAAGDLLTPALRTRFREEIGWNGEEYASVDVPILHRDGSAMYDIHTCFLSPVPMRLFVALIRGPSAAAAMLKAADGVTDVVLPKTDNMELSHGIDHGEAGAIAASCTLAIWGKSLDVQLKACGDTTNIDYEARFEEYLAILLTGLRNKTPSILHVFSEWDRIVFPHAKASAVDPAHKKHGRSDGYRRALAAMRAEEASVSGSQEERAGSEPGSEPARRSPE
ncbi:hypothetical protein C8R46DRAFT_1095149 [Mycena filopes]|nr:hypothetical protein C8R46DRAFT_1095149 [Mycena filopes]